MRTRVKICGITRPEDGMAAAQAGADAIGLVFYAKSPRNVSIEQAQAICAALPPFVTVTALFVDERDEVIRDVLSQVPIDLIQFHGDECPADCGQYGHPYMKALRMREGVNVAAYADTYKDAAGILLDAYVAGEPGGTGQRFDWDRVPQDLNKPVILAGGLEASNIADAIRSAQPFAVDVSGGVEASKGIKDPNKIQSFMRGVCDA